MIYTKARGAELVIVPLKDDEIYSQCPVCGTEVLVDYDMFVSIVNDGEMEESSVYCDPCSDKYQEDRKKKIYRIK